MTQQQFVSRRAKQKAVQDGLSSQLNQLVTTSLKYGSLLLGVFIALLPLVVIFLASLKNG